MRTEDTGPRATLWFISVALVTLTGWAAVGEIDQITRANGQVIASLRTQIIQATDGGVLTDLRVREGDVVRKGEVLAKFDPTKPKASFLESESKEGSLRAQIARLHAEIIDRPPKFDAELKQRYSGFVELQSTLYTRRKDALRAEISAYQTSLALVRKELELNLPLLKSGDVSQTEVLKLQRQVAELESQITNRSNKYLQDAQAELAKAEEDLAGITQIVAQRRDSLEHTELIAPVAGVVKNVRVTTQGGVVRAGEEVLQIVPADDTLIIEAKLKPSDIAFLKLGLPASIKIDAYDYTKYGVLHGKLSYISADTLEENLRQGEQPYYRVQVRTSGGQILNPKNEKIEIQPGMTATVEIQTGKQTVLRYLAKPVLKTLNESLGER